MMTRTWLATAAAAVLLPLLAGPAGAQVVSVTDPRGDGLAGRFGDMGRVKINHAPRKVYFTIYAAKGAEVAPSYDVFVDTKQATKGPEFVASIYLETNDIYVKRIHGFSRQGKQVCVVRNGAKLTGKTLAMTVPRTCLAIAGDEPGTLRASVRSSEDDGTADWAPGVKKFTPWVVHEL